METNIARLPQKPRHISLVVGRYTENTEPICYKTDTDTDVGIWNTEKNTQYRQLNTEKSVRLGILYPFDQLVA